MITALVRFIQVCAAALLLLAFLALQVAVALIVLFLLAFCDGRKR